MVRYQLRQSERETPDGCTTNKTGLLTWRERHHRSEGGVWESFIHRGRAERHDGMPVAVGKPRHAEGRDVSASVAADVNVRR
jgi:hypothetical protein